MPARTSSSVFPWATSVLICSSRHVIGQGASRRRIRRGLHLRLAVFLRDDRRALGKRSQPVHMVAVAVRNKDRGDRLGRDLCDRGKQLSATGGCSLGVDDDHAVGADDEARISSTPFHPVDVWLQLMDAKPLRRSPTPPPPPPPARRLAP